MKSHDSSTKNEPKSSPNTFQQTRSQSGDIIEFILRDHKPLKKMIETLKDSDIDRSEKEGQYEKFVPLLLAHAKAEEKTLYVAMKKLKRLRLEGLEGDTEHRITEQLVHEINATPDDDQGMRK